MACRWEEEIFRFEGKMDECGCPTCLYRTLAECYEEPTGVLIDETVAAIRDGMAIDEILNMPEMESWPETYVWVKNELKSEN